MKIHFFNTNSFLNINIFFKYKYFSSIRTIGANDHQALVVYFWANTPKNLPKTVFHS